MQIQNVDDDNDLYRWIHPKSIVNGKVTSAAFKHGDIEKTRQLSVDIAELTTKEECLSFSNNPDMRIAVLVAGQVRKLDTQDVIHDPLPPRYSHALIIGEKPRRVCKLLARNCVLLPLTSGI